MAISSINTNTQALFTQRQMTSGLSSSAQTSAQLASGQRINSAADDAAGLAIGTGLNTQMRGMEQAIRNTNDGISMLQVAGGTLSQGTDILQRMRELTLQSANGILNERDRNAIDKEYTQLVDQLETIQQGTSFNGQKLFSEDGESVTLQVGESANDRIDFTLNSFDLDALKNPSNDPTSKLAAIDDALGSINQAQADIGATTNRLESAANTLGNSLQSSAEAYSRTMDTDYAAALSERSQQQLKEQVQIAMLAQANAAPKQVLRLLGLGN